MEKINDKFYLDSDSNNLILLQRKIHGETSDKSGEEYFKTVGYFTTLESVYRRVIEMEIKDDLGLIKNMGKVVELIKELETKVEEIEESKENVNI